MAKKCKLVEVSNVSGLPKILWSVRAKKLIIKGENVTCDEGLWVDELCIHDDASFAVAQDLERGNENAKIQLNIPFSVSYSIEGVIYYTEVEYTNKRNIKVTTKRHLPRLDKWITIEDRVLKVRASKKAFCAAG